MLGRQEGALRELLRQFREGDVERALRHALPLGGDGGRGGHALGRRQAPRRSTRRTRSSRSSGSGRGPTGIWFGGFDVQAELAREYRKAAEEAERRGDYRRAAYIHGKLLNDFATAAHLLCPGGPAPRRGLHLPEPPQGHPGGGPGVRGGRRGRPGPAALPPEPAPRRGRRPAPPGRRGGGGRRRVRSGPPTSWPPTPGTARWPPATCSATGPVGPTWPWPITPRAGADRPSANAVPCALRMASIFADRGEVRPRWSAWSTRPTPCCGGRVARRPPSSSTTSWPGWPTARRWPRSATTSATAR